jgi:hypothetical protein
MSNEPPDAMPLDHVERCPLCSTIMTAERGAPIHLANPRRAIILPGEEDAVIGADRTITRLRCENGHTFWLIEDDEAE